MPDAVSSTPVVSNVSDLMTTQKQVASPNPNGELGKDAFLKLLVAQLKYQDPSSPVDSSQFMAQTAAFTQVEKLDAMAKDSSANLALQQGLAASALVGRTVSYVDDKGVTQRGVVTSASFGGSGSAEPSVHIGDTAVPLSSIVSVDDGSAPAPVPADGDASEVTPETDADTKTAEQKAAEQKAMTDAISAALTQAFAGGVTGSIADAVAQAVAAAMAAAGTTTSSTTTTSTTTTTGMDATTSGTGTDATNGTTNDGSTTDGSTTDGSTTSTSPATAGPTS